MTNGKFGIPIGKFHSAEETKLRHRLRNKRKKLARKDRQPTEADLKKIAAENAKKSQWQIHLETVAREHPELMIGRRHSAMPRGSISSALEQLRRDREKAAEEEAKSIREIAAASKA